MFATLIILTSIRNISFRAFLNTHIDRNYLTVNICSMLGGSPGLAVKALGCKSQLDGHISHIFVVMFVWTYKKEAGDGPFKKGQKLKNSIRSMQFGQTENELRPQIWGDKEVWLWPDEANQWMTHEREISDRPDRTRQDQLWRPRQSWTERRILKWRKKSFG